MDGALVPRLTWHDYAVLAIYFVIQFAVGAYFTRRERDTATFFLGNRSVVWWAAGLSIFGTAISAITYVSIPATAYAGDWSTIAYNLGTLFLAPFVALVFLPRIRLSSLTTAYQYLEERFNILARLYGSAVFFTFQTGRMAIVLYLPAVMLHTATGMSVYYSILTMGLITTVYTVLGGIEAVIWTDVLQSIIFVGCALLALWLLYAAVDGGPAAVFRDAIEADKINVFEWDPSLVSASIWIAVIGGIFFNAYPMMAEQTVVQKYLATAGTKEAARAVWTNAILTVPIQFIFFGLGTGLWAFYRQNPSQLDTSLERDAILPQFVMQEFPVGLKGAFIAGLFAASMSSLASSMNSMATVTVNDFYRRFAPSVSDARALWAARICTAVFGLFATGASLYVATTERAGTMFELFISFLGLLGGGLAALFVLGTCTRRANGPGVMIGAAVSGVLMYIIANVENVSIGKFVVHPNQLHGFLHAFVGFTTCFVVGYLASLAIRRR